MTQSFGALQRLLTTEISVQEAQLECLENILLLAGERSSSLPDPHHIVEGSAADRLLAELMGQEEKHQRVVPLVSAEVERIEHRMGRQEGTPPSHLRLLCNELMDFAALQTEALESLQQSRSTSSGFHIQATMASKLFDVLATKLELLRELQEGMIEHHATAAVDAATHSARQQQQSRPPNQQAADVGTGGGRGLVDALSSKLGISDGATKGSMGQRMAKSIAADGVNALSSMLSNKHDGAALAIRGDAATSIAQRLLQHHADREGSTASSAASYKNAFHEAVFRTMMQSESPEQAVSDAVTRMQRVKQRSSSEESIGSVVSSTTDNAATAQRRRRARRSASASPSPAPLAASSTKENVVHRGGTSRSSERSPTPLEINHAADAAAVAALREEVHELQGATGDLLSEANRIILDCDDAVLQFGTENEALRNEIRRLRHTAESRRSKVDSMDADMERSMASLRKELHEARTERNEAKQSLEEERRRAQATGRELSALQDLHRSLTERCEQQGSDIRRLKESEAILCDEASAMRHAQQDALRRRDQVERDTNAKVHALQLRVEALEQEASTSFAQLEAARKSLAATERKLAEKQAEAKDVKVLFTQLEAAHQAAKQEVQSLRSVLGEKNDALHRYANVSRLRDNYSSGGAAGSDPSLAGAAAGASPPRTLKPSGSVLPSPAGGGGQPPAASESVGPTRRGSHGRIVRLSFESPGRTDGSRPPPAHTGAAPPQEDVRPTSRGPAATSSGNVYKVLSDAAQLLDAIHRGKRAAVHKKESSPHPNEESSTCRGTEMTGDADNVTPSLQAMNGSEDGYAAVVPTPNAAAGRQPTQQLLHELELKERHLMAEAASLAEQERSVLDKRTVVSSTLLAQRNQMLMKNAPDEEVEALNNQISVVMERINQATGQIQQNKRTVEKKMDLLQRQRRVLLSSGA